MVRITANSEAVSNALLLFLRICPRYTAEKNSSAVIIALIGLALAASNNLNIYGSLIFHFVGDVFVIANSFRLFRFGEGYAAVESEVTEDAPQRRSASMSLGQPVPA